MNTKHTSQYDLNGITVAKHYRSGALMSCLLNAENILPTPVGDMIPQYRSAELGERQKKYRSSIDFFENGQIKSVALDKKTPLKTPLGVINAELVTFYEDGSLNRIFPLNGLIDGYWSENNERDMAEVIDLSLPLGRFSVKVISIHFYPSGALKTLTVWPGQALYLQTPIGWVKGRTGFSLYENGSIRSCEPGMPTRLPTPIGAVKAYDPDIIGMHADQNSVQFSPEGKLLSIKTIHTGIRAVDTNGEESTVAPYEGESYIDHSQKRTFPIKINFSEDAIHIEAKSEYVFPLAEYQISTFERSQILFETCADCPGDESCCKNSGETGSCGKCSGS